MGSFLRAGSVLPTRQVRSGDGAVAEVDGLRRAVVEVPLHLGAGDQTDDARAVEFGGVSCGAVTRQIVVAGFPHPGVIAFLASWHRMPP